MFDQAFIDEFLKSKVFAVVGVSPNKEKYGYQVFEDLKEGGYTVYAVNPTYDDIYGEPCFKDLASLPEKPDVIDFVCPPKVTESMVEELPGLGIDKAWIQPGAESEKAISFCHDNGIKVLYEICVMVERGKRGQIV